MRILVIADIHGEFEKLSEIIDKFKAEPFDLVVCPGDFTDMYSVPEGYSQIDVAEVVLQKILSLGKPTFCVPGNQDPYEILDLFDEYGVNIHNTMKNFKGIDFAGFGGAATPFNTKFEPTEEEITQHLTGLLKGVKKRFVLVVHNPPHRTKLDKIQTGEHVGSKAIRNLIEKHKPILMISAHIHEAGGIDMLGKSVLFYPGAVYDGFVGVVEIKKDVKCEIKKM